MRVDNPHTLAPRKAAMAFIRSRNIWYEFAFGIPCDPEGCPDVHGYILRERYSAAL